MTLFESLYLCVSPFLPCLYGKVHNELVSISKGYQSPRILDVGGRRSHYTIGVPASITITDLERTSEVQQQLGLGLNHAMIASTIERRSNVETIIVDDITQSSLADSSFDCIVAVEVIEHIEQDHLFVKEVHRLLKPGGAVLLTTPNGEFVKNTNPDHKRHYTRGQLRDLLNTRFKEPDVHYAVKNGMFYALGLRSWSFRHPVRTLLSMVGNFINGIQSAPKTVGQQSHGTQHLIATARKAA